MFSNFVDDRRYSVLGRISVDCVIECKVVGIQIELKSFSWDGHGDDKNAAQERGCGVSISAKVPEFKLRDLRENALASREE